MSRPNSDDLLLAQPCELTCIVAEPFAQDGLVMLAQPRGRQAVAVRIPVDADSEPDLRDLSAIGNRGVKESALEEMRILCHVVDAVHWSGRNIGLDEYS